MFTYSNGYWEVYKRFQGDFFGLEGGLRGGVTWEDLSLEEFVMGEDNLHDILALFKKNEKINMKKFFQLKVRISIKT